MPAATRRQRPLFEDGDEGFVNEVVVCEVGAGLRGEDVPELTTLLEPIEFIQPGAESAMPAGAWCERARRRG